MKLKLVSLVILLAAGTLLAQTAEEKRKRYEAYRSRLSRGALPIGSALHACFAVQTLRNLSEA